MKNEKNITNIILLLTLAFSLAVPSWEYLIILIPLLIFILKFQIIDSIFYFLLYLGISGNGNYLLETLNLPFSQVLIPIFSLLYIVVFMKKSINRTTFNFILIISLMFIIYIIFGSVNGVYSGVINLIFYFILIFIYLLSLILIVNKEKLTDIIQVLIFSIIFMCFISINLWLFSSDSIYNNNYFNRATGVFGNPNLLAQNILLLTPAIFTGWRKFYFLSLFSLTLVVVTIIITQSRGSISLLFLIIVFHIIFDKRAQLFDKVKFSILFVIITLLSLILIDDNYYERFSIGSNSRLDALNQGIKGFFSSPFGVGIGNTANNELNLSSHNNYVHIISEIGLLGIILISLLMIYLLFSWRYSFIHKKTFTFYLIPIILFVSFFTHNLLTNHIIYITILISFFEIKLKSDF